MIQRLRRFLNLESYEEALRDFALVVEQSELLKSEIDLMAREYLGSAKDLSEWAGKEKEQEVLELIKSQQDGLTSRYLTFLSEKKLEYTKLEDQKKAHITKHPDFEKALVELKKSDFIEKTLKDYREQRLTLDECDIFIKAVTKNKVYYADNIVFNQNGELLIAQRQPLGSLKDGANLWVLPGGHVNLGEPCIAAAKRELLEETGYEVEDLYFVGDFDEGDVHIEYFMSMIDDREQSPTVDAEETRATAFIPVNDLYKYPTQFINMWDNVYRILGIESIVPIKKAVAEGLVKASEAADAKVDEVVGGKDKKRKKVKKVMDEWKAGTLKSSSGDKVTNQKQAIAIALNESGQSISKAMSGVYENTDENRKLGRVGQKYGHKKDVNNSLGLKKGDKVQFKREYQDKGDEGFVKELMEDPDGGRVKVRTNVPNMGIKPTEVVQVDWLERIDNKKESQGEFKQFEDIVNSSSSADEAYAKAKTIKGVPLKTANAFYEKYAQDGKLGMREAFEAFYNEVKGGSSSKEMTPKEIQDKYTYKNGYNVSYLENQSFSTDSFTRYYNVSKLQGTYPDYTRDKYGSPLMDDFKWFKEVASGKYKESIDPYDEARGLNKAKEDTLHGGDADGKTLEDIAKHHGVSLEEITEEWSIGVKEEKEHTKDAEKRSEITKDHLWKDAKYYTKLKTIEKGSFAEFEKARALGHLVPKKVQIKGKTGQIHWAIRWVNPTTGESEKFADVKEGEKVEGQTFEDQVAAIANGGMKKNEKVYNLINMGIYDPKVLTLLTGETYPQRYIKQADINLKDLPDQSEVIKDKIRTEQGNNDTPEGREENQLLMRNPEDVELLWAKYRLNVKTVLRGNHKLCIAYGTGGVGKTFNAMKVIENFVPEGDEADFKLRRFNKEIQPDRDQYDYVIVKGRISTVQVYAEMYRHRDKIIVFDDCDSFMANPDVQGFLKGGLDTSKDCEISNLTGRKIYNIQGDETSGEIPDTFKFKGGVIAITNLQIGDFKEKAVITRSLLNNLAMTVDETLRMIEGFKDKMEVYSADKAKVIPVSQENRDLAFAMLTEQKDKLSAEDVNGRMYSNMALQAQEAEDEGLDRATVRKMTQLYIDSVSNSFNKQMKEQRSQQQSKSK